MQQAFKLGGFSRKQLATLTAEYELSLPSNQQIPSNGVRTENAGSSATDSKLNHMSCLISFQTGILSSSHVCLSCFYHPLQIDVTLFYLDVSKKAAVRIIGVNLQYSNILSLRFIQSTIFQSSESQIYSIYNIPIFWVSDLFTRCELISQMY